MHGQRCGERGDTRGRHGNRQCCVHDAGLSQSELAEISDIPVRTIQQYEQKQKNINDAKAENVVKLAKALNTSVEKLMEIEIE